MKKFSIDNFKKGIITTVLGLILIVVGVVLFFLPQATILEATTVIVLGLSLLGVKDPRIPGGKTTIGVFLALIWVTLFILFITGCVTAQKCADKFGTGETHTVTVKDSVEAKVVVPIKGDKISLKIGIDSLLAVPSNKPVPDTFIIREGRAQAKFWKDKYNNYLNGNVECLPDTVVVTEKVPIEVEAECPDTLVLDPEKGLTWWQKLWRGFQFFSAWAVMILFAWLLTNRVLRSLKA
ncbi:hypothetical protein C900_05359 [Fulvivirga imtechensis AK7]|uniref:Uncharacterized protein n=1 Tax=Fulvivirga imtechensis AK7 TaxID=1237149 RepID=L8JLP7_9BACT|nr:hypothetical protein [Fulvivirga imtechensis]ELR69163.1 hypothetical protein C900_05359 [Fulvivirga imtechensis AK7]